MFTKLRIFCLLLVASNPALALMLGSDQSGNLISIDLTTGAGSFIGRESGFPLSTEIEYDNNSGTLYSDETNGFTFLHTIDVNSGLSSGAVEHDCCAFNGMEFVGSTLYVTNNTSGSWQLGSVNPETGALTLLGSRTLGETITGLAYDAGAGVMYGITGGGNGAQSMLLTIDLLTGLAATVAPVFDAATGAQLNVIGSMEFGADGVLYGGMGLNASINPGQLFSLALDGEARFLGGDTGLEGITGLTAITRVIPVPAAVWLFGAALIGLAGFGRLGKKA